MLYKLINELLYFDNDKRGLRLCISLIMKIKVFKLTYNEIRYPGYAQIHERLMKGLYIFNIIIKLYEFIWYCFYYQLNQIPRYKVYEFL